MTRSFGVIVGCVVLLSGCRPAPEAEQVPVIKAVASTDTPKSVAVAEDGPIVASVAATPCPDRQALSRAALRRLKIAGVSALGVWLRQNSAAAVAESRREVTALREWAATLEDACAREAYEGWADHYERHVREAEEELLDGRHVRVSQDAYEKRLKKEDAEVRRLLTSIPKPPALR
jgi:hypothetical protein